MNKTAIKNFAIWARNKLISDISYKAGLLGITEKGIKSPLPQSTQTVQFFNIGTKEPSSITGIEIQQRKKLVEEIERKAKQSDYTTAYKNVIEEVAYTWFNRLVAIRFMEVNDYLPTRIRVLSSESNGKAEPDLVTHALEADLVYSAYEKDRIIQLKQENELDELFRMLFIKQCNALNANLPELFEKTSDYTELLLNISFTDKEGVIYHLVNDIDEDDFNVSKEGQVEIIGWMYQYYISEKHDEIINIYKGTIKKDDIPAATQLFTTNWVVRYMVDNSLGRYWIERNPNSKLAKKLEFFVTPKNGVINYIEEQVQPQDLTFFDPCMGSGHILVYAFDVLIEIYRECGYSDRDAALNIVQFNLFGMDIDKRAYQLAYFAVMMKVRSFNRRALTQGVVNNLTVIEESNSLRKFSYEGLANNNEQNKVGEYLIDVFRHAKEIGSLQTIEKRDYRAFAEYLLSIQNDTEPIDIFSSSWSITTLPLMLQLTKQAHILSGKYAVVCTNPPYMNKLESHLKDFVVNNYKAYSGDLFSVFMYRNFDLCKRDGYSAFMTPNVWMFIKSYEKLRNYIIDNKTIISLVQMAKGAFFKEATVDICCFILKNQKTHEEGLFIRLEDFKGGMEVQQQKVLEAQANKNCGYFYEASQDNFSKIPGSPIAYWVSDNIFKIFEVGVRLDEFAEPRKGLTSADDSNYLRIWYEVDNFRIKFDSNTQDEAKASKAKWFPVNKGGEFRKWYGNNTYVINWGNNGEQLRTFKNAAIRNTEYYFKKCISWNDITSKNVSFRYKESGQIFNDAGPSIFAEYDKLMWLLGLGNSTVAQEICYLVAPTIHYGVGQIAKLPIMYNDNEGINEIVERNIAISRDDWDSFESSWYFKRHPFINGERTIRSAFDMWERETVERFSTLKSNEEELNRIFIDIYGLQDELTPEVEDKDVTVRKADLKRDIKSLISYAVGCMLGRYSLDAEGLAFAGGDWDQSKYSTYLPDKDNCLPITDEEYFHDDIVGRFVEFIKTVYGADTLEENLDFIASALGNRGNSSRDIIRKYFLNDFIKDHIKIYQKRPIYWMFNSGKQNGFKALIYMHRYDEDTIGKLRIDYLHRMQRIYENEIARMQDTIENSKDAREVTAATKRKEKLIKQLQETKEYDEKIAHLALARTSIDLDDGVKVNYEKIQTDRDGKKLDVLAKI